MRSRRRLVLGLALTAAVLPALLGASKLPNVAGGQLKAGDLEGIAKQGSVALLGFSWTGEARLFEQEVALDQVSSPAAGDRDFKIIAKGGASVCEGLKKLATESQPLSKARLTFRSSEGSGASFRLQGLRVESADCAAKPWAASLSAESVNAGEPSEKKGKGKKNRGDREEVGSRP